MQESGPTEVVTLPALARQRVQAGPVPEWVTSRSCDFSFQAKTTPQVTQLLLERQYQAELGQTFLRTVFRLETPQAVQQLSQWRFDFDPQTQTVVFHWIRIRRGGVETDQTAIERLQFLQREQGLDGLVITGAITILQVLENVAPGDIVDWALTLTNRPRLLPESAGQFFFLPAGVEAGAYYFSVLHRAERGLRWTSSAKELAPVVEAATDAAGGLTRWVWQAGPTTTLEVEPYTPGWETAFPYMQVSDCADWESLARAVAEAWVSEPPGEALAALTATARGAGADRAAQVTRAIELVQDEFRYLSVNLELGGQIPAPREVVARRRYGDCKDLACLLTELLRSLGVAARPVLVGTRWRRRIGGLLPAPSLFNHVVVEFELGGERRWVDATAKRQGGGALERRVMDFGLGLPVEAGTTAPVVVPRASLPGGTLEVKETLLLDTTGQPSCLAVVMTARGGPADALRFEFENEGIEAVAKKRLQQCANRFSTASRLAPLQYRDDRLRNEFVVAEGFEINGFLKLLPGGQAYAFGLQGQAAAGVFALPAAGPRREPFALPFPCSQTHVIEIESGGAPKVAMPPAQIGNEFLTFGRRCKALRHYLRLTFFVDVLAESLPAARVAAHRKMVEQIWSAASIQFRIPRGHGRPRKREGFGLLPAFEPPRRPAGAVPPPPPVVRQTAPATTEVARRSAPGAPAGAPAAAEHAAQPEGEAGPSPVVDGPAKWNPASIGSAGVLVAALVCAVIARAVRDQPGVDNPAAGFFGLGAMLWMLACVLGLVGSWRGKRQPWRYRYGRKFSDAVMASSFATLVLLPIISGPAPGQRTGTARMAPPPPARRALLRFPSFHFVYRPPAAPWGQVDAARTGPANLVAFARPDQLTFVITVPKPTAAQADWDLARYATWVRTGLTNYPAAVEIKAEGAARHGQMDGWEWETHAWSQGREIYSVRFLCVTNGFAYLMQTWGPPALETRIRQESGKLCALFQPTAPPTVAEASPGTADPAATGSSGGRK